MLVSEVLDLHRLHSNPETLDKYKEVEAYKKENLPKLRELELKFSEAVDQLHNLKQEAYKTSEYVRLV